MIKLPAPEKPAILVQTSFTIGLVELYRRDDDLQHAQRVELLQAGGTRDLGTHIDVYRQDRFPLFQVGERYLLFLRRTEAGAYGLATGTPDAAFLLESTRIIPRGNSALAHELARRGRARVVAELRARGRN